MNNLLVFEHEIQNENLCKIKDTERIAHVQDILKKGSGDELKLCLVDSGLAQGKIVEIAPESMTIEIGERKNGLQRNISLLVGISRPPTIKKILEHGTSLGVNEFHFFNCELTEKSYLSSNLFRDEEYKKHLEFGLSQSKVFFQMPSVNLYEKLPDLSRFERHQKYLLKMDAGITFNSVSPSNNSPIVLAAGPERGLINSENEYFEKSGFHPIEISPSTLRVEIACFAALSQLNLFL